MEKTSGIAKNEIPAAVCEQTLRNLSKVYSKTVRGETSNGRRN
jgi:hypothetical protein